MNAILESIELVSALASNKRSAKAVLASEKHSAHFARLSQEYRSSIILVSQLFEEYAKRELKETASKKPICRKAAHLCAIRAVSLIANRAPAFDLGTSSNDKYTFLQAISKNNDENFHSDFLASLLDSSLMGNFSYELLKQILSATDKSNCSVNTEKPIRVQREKRLDSIDESLYNSEMGARRIDLYIRHNNFILIIENKISTSESDNQTTDYYSVTKNIHSDLVVAGVLLSPSGQTALESTFSPMTYRDLVMCLNKSENCLNSVFARKYFNLYYESLFRQFVESDNLYSGMVENFWRNSK